MAFSFKSDDSFLRKLTVGAAGTNATILALKTMGFNPIELERGSTGYKIWKKIKIKRIRVPDILCLNTGMRFESRGKTKLEISMSHSLSDPNRAWDFGMRDEDHVSIVVFNQDENNPTLLSQISPIHFISVKDLRQTFKNKQITITKAKGFEEGSEIRVIWNCAAANIKSSVAAIEPTRIILGTLDNPRSQVIQLSRNKGKITLIPTVNLSDVVESNQIVASVVPVNTSITCPTTVDEKYFLDKLSSVNLSDRYAAAKALRYRGYTTAKQLLELRIADPMEDIYVQLEAAAALAEFDEPKGWEFIENKLHSSIFHVPLETQLETIIVASELPKERSERLIIEVLQDNNRDDEIRAGAAWALGQYSSINSAKTLVDTFNSNVLDIKIEAARALLRIAEPQLQQLIEMLKTCDPSKRDGISWVIARTGNVDPLTLINNADENLRRWISYIIGFGKDKFVNSDIEAICNSDPEIYFAASVLWQIMASWVYNLKEY